MKHKRLKEEKALRDFSRHTWKGGAWEYDSETGHRKESILITAFANAIRKNEQKIAIQKCRIALKGTSGSHLIDLIATAIKG